MSIKRKEGEGDLDRSSWEGMGASELNPEIAKFILEVRDKFFDNEKFLDLEETALDTILTMNEDTKNKSSKTLIEISELGIRGYLEKIISKEEIEILDKEESRRLIDHLQYTGSTPG